MTPSLSPSLARVARARQLQAEFQAAIEEYTSQFQCAINFDPQTGWTSLHLVIDPLVDSTSMALLVGDVLHNLRSALDYLVWQLVLAAGKQPTDKTSFLIADTQHTWASNHASKLAGVDSVWLAKIEAHQPYKAAVPTQHPLAQLDSLNNYTKHRLIPSAISQAKHVVLNNTAVVGGVTYEFDYVESRLSSGDYFFRMRGNDGQPINLGPDVEATWRISFDDGKSGEWDLEPLIAYVEGLLDDFSGAF